MVLLWQYEKSSFARLASHQANRALWVGWRAGCCLPANGDVPFPSGPRTKTATSDKLGGHAAPPATKHQNGGWYFRSGQWRADIRSIAAAIRFILEPADDPYNSSISPATPPVLPMEASQEGLRVEHD